MANVTGTKWGSNELGTAGGIVTWSIAAAGTDISRFGVDTQTSVSGSSFLDYDFVQVIADAFAEWSKYGDIEFEQVADQGGAAGVGADADIRIFFGAIPGGTAGYAFYPSSWGSAIAGDILLDTIDRFNNDPVLFFNLVLHEVGHSLGLGHVDSASIMTPSVKKIGLQADDIAGIQEIYGVQDGASDHSDACDCPDCCNNNNDGMDTDGDGHDHNHDDHDHNHDHGDQEPAHPILDGNDAFNRIVGTSTAEIINGYNGADTLIGRDGDDTLNGGEGIDKLKGGSGDDVLSGQNGNDKLLAGIGDDLLNGGADNDILKGGHGNDTLNGGTGNDKLVGRYDDDTFEFTDGHGHDVIVDFDAISAGEKIDLTGLTSLQSISEVLESASQVKGHVKIDTGADSSILLKWVAINDLDSSDFVF